ncbi:MAG: hypothetical protein ABH896_02505 [Candidatus Jacksonbacteria bacterium]
MKTSLLLDKLKSISKSYFSSKDIAKFYSGSLKEATVVIHRLVKQKKLVRLLRGYYTLNLARVDWEQLACELIQPSYISFEYALNYYGIIDQIPMRITLATTKKGREYELPGQIFEYSHFTPKVYFGYQIQGNMVIAEREKALLDELYLISLKKRHLSLEGLNLNQINKKLFNQWLRKFPVYTQKLAKTLKI